MVEARSELRRFLLPHQKKTSLAGTGSRDRHPPLISESECIWNQARTPINLMGDEEQSHDPNRVSLAGSGAASCDDAQVCSTPLSCATCLGFKMGSE